MGLIAYKEGKYRGGKQQKPKQRYESLEELNSALKSKETSLDDNTDEFIAGLTKSFKLREDLGIILNEDGSVPSTEGTPRMFIIDKGEDGKDTMMSFEQAGIEYGSREFWKKAQLGKVYAYPAGEIYPVQLSLNIRNTSPYITVSGLLEPGNVVPQNEEIARPGLFQRFLHSINKNWASEDTRAYYAKEASAASDEKIRNSIAAIAAQRIRGCGEEIRELREKESELYADAAQRDALEHAEDLDKKLYEKQNGLKTYRDLTAPTPVFDPEREKINDGPNKKEGLYLKSDFDKLEKIDVKLEDLKVGGEPVSEEAYMGLVASCSSSPELIEEQLSATREYDPTLIESLQGMGFSKEHILKAHAFNFTDFTYGDFMRIDQLRDGESNLFGSAINKGRKKAVELLQNYRKGEPGSKKALAEAMTRGMKQISHPTEDRSNPSMHYLKQCRVMNSMAELLEKDPELKAIAMNECGLTAEEYKSVRGMGILDKADLKAGEAESALANAALGKGPELSEAQKKQYAVDIIQSRLITQRFSSEVTLDNRSPELQAVDKMGDDKLSECITEGRMPSAAMVRKWQANPGTRPLPPEGKLYTDQIQAYKMCLMEGKIKVKKFAVELGEKGPEDMRRLAEAIVEKDNLGNLSISELDKKLSGNQYRQNSLISNAEKTAEAMRHGKHDAKQAAEPDDPALGENLNINQEMKNSRPRGMQL